MRVVFLGTPRFALPSLEALLRSRHEVIAVFTQPDRPAGRGRKPTAPPVKRLAQGASLPLFQPPRVRAADVEPLAPEVGAVVAFGRILSRKLLAVPPRGFLNVHASLLPAYRGAAPVQRALMDGASETGVSIFQLEPELDAGPILLQRAVSIGPEETAESLEARLAELGASLLLEALEGLESGTLHPRPQDHRLATYAPKVTREESLIDWTLPAEAIERRVRALQPWPLAETCLEGVPLKVWRAELFRSVDRRSVDRRSVDRRSVDRPGDEAAPPGMVLGVAEGRSERGILVQTGQGALLLTQLQPPGKKPMSARAFLAGHRVERGMVLRRSVDRRSVDR
ncbi:MAG: methionyl-tRNA formyltransferase [Nitrospinota bacterium]